MNTLSAWLERLSPRRILEIAAFALADTARIKVAPTLPLTLELLERLAAAGAIGKLSPPSAPSPGSTVFTTPIEGLQWRPTEDIGDLLDLRKV